MPLTPIRFINMLLHIFWAIQLWLPGLFLLSPAYHTHERLATQRGWAAAATVIVLVGAIGLAAKAPRVTFTAVLLSIAWWAFNGMAFLWAAPHSLGWGMLFAWALAMGTQLGRVP